MQHQDSGRNLMHKTLDLANSL